MGIRHTSSTLAEQYRTVLGLMVLICTPMVAMFTFFWFKAFNSLIKACDIWLLRTEMQAEIGREEQDMLLAGIAVFPPTGNGG